MLQNGKSVTTIGIYLRSVRTIFNIKKAIAFTDISLLFNYKAPSGSSMEMAKDYWMFIYFCNGINVKDMCLLKYKNIQGDIIIFERSKTVRTKRKVEPIRVPLLIETFNIIKKWGNKNVNNETYIFPVLTDNLSAERERQLIKQLNDVINANMKNIAKVVGIQQVVTTYVARHSFATVS